MKRAWILVTFLSVLAVICFSMPAVAETSGELNNISWTLSDDGELRISGTEYTMDKLGLEKEKIKTVIIESGETSIRQYCFYNCSNITHVSIPDTVISIEHSAFEGCTGLASVTISEGVTSIGTGAFAGCTGLASITIPKSVTEIGYGAFQGCTGLTSFKIPEGVISIADSTFEGCSSLTSISIPDSVTEIGYCAFKDCSSLASITIPEQVTSIAYRSFYGCASLTSITIPDSITDIQEEAFYKCNSLASITIPKKITQIKDKVFYRCSSLTNITLPDGITSIGEFAFGTCSSLTSITIPESVTSIGNQAFYNCSGLTDIAIPKSVTSIGKWAFGNCSALRSVTILDGVTGIGDSVFYNCDNLKKVYIPRSATSIEKNFFCTPKPTVYCYEFSAAEGWALKNEFPLILLDDLDTSGIIEVELPEKIQMLIGSKQQITADIFPDISSPKINWSVSHPDILQIDDNGIITALKVGESIVTATVDGVSASSVVEVSPIIDKIILPEEILVAAKSKETFTFEYVPENAQVDFICEIDDNRLAEIDENRIILGYAIGETSITVMERLSGKTEKAKLVICYPVTEIELSPGSATMKSGDSLQMNAHVTMRTQTCENQLVTYSSSDENIATVDASGTVTAKSAGTVTITATATSGVSASSQITVISQYLPGDVNDDGTVDGRDVLRLMKYLAGEEDPVTGEPIEINKDNADVDGNGAINEKDLLRLIRYLGGEDVDLKPGAMSGNG